MANKESSNTSELPIVSQTNICADKERANNSFKRVLFKDNQLKCSSRVSKSKPIIKLYTKVQLIKCLIDEL